MLPYSLFKQLAFKLDPELIHEKSLELAAKHPKLLATLMTSAKPDKKYQVKSHSLNWDFPVGLAAGLDKNAQALPFFQALGFGAIEYGTITPLPQIGNPRPRIFRHPKIESLQNSMGFPNDGMDKIFQNVKSAEVNICTGANIGKNKESDNEKIYDDYKVLYQKFAPLADYLVINVSSPNTPGLRNLQSKEFLTTILTELKASRQEVNKPLFIKVAPDLEEGQAQDFVDVAQQFNLSGVIATNTTIDHQFGKGGLSGKYMTAKAKKVRNQLLEISKGTNLDIIGVGGISSFVELRDFWENGGQLAQVYTSFIYQGPELLKEIARGIDLFLKQRTCKNLQQYFDQR